MFARALLYRMRLCSRFCLDLVVSRFTVSLDLPCISIYRTLYTPKHQTSDVGVILGVILSSLNRSNSQSTILSVLRIPTKILMIAFLQHHSVYKKTLA